MRKSALVFIGLLISALVLVGVVSATFAHVELANGATLPGGGTLNVPMPTGTGGIVSGDLLIVAVMSDDAVDTLECSNAGPDTWTLVTGADSGGYVRVCARIAIGSETNFALSNPSGLILGQSYRVAGWRGGAISSGTISGTSVRTVGGAPDPPSHNPSGWDVEDTLWLTAVAMANNAQGRDISTAPTDFTEIRYDDGTQQSMMSAYNKSSVASKDSGPFVVTENPPSWQAWTVSIRPFETAQLVTLAASDVNFNRAELNGRLDTLNSASADLWFEYGTTSALGTESDHTSRSTIGTFTVTVRNLEPETTYFFRAMSLEVPSGMNATGEILTFTTLESPILDFLSVASVLGFMLVLALGLYGAWWIKKRRGGGLA